MKSSEIIRIGHGYFLQVVNVLGGNFTVVEVFGMIAANQVELRWRSFATAIAENRYLSRALFSVEVFVLMLGEGRLGLLYIMKYSHEESGGTFSNLVVPNCESIIFPKKCQQTL